MQGFDHFRFCLFSFDCLHSGIRLSFPRLRWLRLVSSANVGQLRVGLSGPALAPFTLLNHFVAGSIYPPADLAAYRASHGPFQVLQPWSVCEPTLP